MSSLHFLPQLKPIGIWTSCLAFIVSVSIMGNHPLTLTPTPAPPALVLVHQVPASSCTREVLASSELCAALIETLESSTGDHSMAIYWEVRRAEKHEGNVAAYNEALGASCRSAGFGYNNLDEFNGCVDCLDALGDCETWTRILFQIGCSLIPLSVLPLFYLCCCSRPPPPPLKVADVPLTGLPTASLLATNPAVIADEAPSRAAIDADDVEAAAV